MPLNVKFQIRAKQQIKLRRQTQKNNKFQYSENRKEDKMQ